MGNRVFKFHSGTSGIQNADGMAKSSAANGTGLMWGGRAATNVTGCNDLPRERPYTTVASLLCWQVDRFVKRAMEGLGLAPMPFAALKLCCNIDAPCQFVCVRSRSSGLLLDAPATERALKGLG